MISVFWIVLVQWLFYFFHQQQIRNTQRGFLSQMKQDMEYGDFEHMLKTLNHLESLNIIQCPAVKMESDSTQSKLKRFVIDSSSKDSLSSSSSHCHESFLLNLRSRKTYILKAPNGELFYFNIFMGGSASFVMALWLSRVFGIVVSFLLIFFYRMKKRKDRELLALKMAQLKMIEEKAKMKQEKALAIEDVARQVSHDIRSPLTALNVAMQDVDHVPERHRVLIRNATNRIHDIANNLLKKHQAPPSPSEVLPKKEEKSLLLLSSLMSLVVAEKRLQFRPYMNLEINFVLNPISYGLFARVESEGLKSILSNFINNGVEALPFRRGKIQIELFTKGKWIHLSVRDNGKGMDLGILKRLGREKFTYGKDGTESGSGIGVYNAKKKIEEWGGTLQVESKLGKGSTFFILLPKEDPPRWFVPQIEIGHETCIVILDDDNSIHEIWKDRFDSDLRKLHFSSSGDFKKWHEKDQKAPPQRTRLPGTPEPRAVSGGGSPFLLYLIDYELIGDEETGLDLIEKLHLGRQAILVTSRFDSGKIREHCQHLGVKLIPKELAYLVPIIYKSPSL